MSDTLIVYASFGEGHKRAAYALEEALGAPCKDLLDFSHPFFRKLYPSIYLAITQYCPFLWQFLFFSVKKKSFSRAVTFINKILFHRFTRYLYYTKPKTIVLTHFFPSSIIEDIKKDLNFKIMSVITDLRVYPLWVNDSVDYYFAALDITKNDLIRLGVDEQKIAVGFAPLRQGFLKQRKEFSLPENLFLRKKPVLIFTSSSKKTLALLKGSIKLILKDFNIIVIYGRNKRLHNYLRQLNSSYVKFFAFYHHIWDLISASSIIIGKPGGLTIFEGIYNKKPFIFTHYIPGQEKENMDLLIGYNIAKFVKTPQEFVDAVYYFAKNLSNLTKKYPLIIKDIH